MPSGGLQVEYKPDKLFLTMLQTGPQTAFFFMQATLRDIGRTFVTDFKKRRMGRKTASSVGRRSGALARSLGSRTRGNHLGNLDLVIGFGPPAHPWSETAARYADIHETGGTIRMKSKFLAIPLNTTRAGKPKGGISSPRQLSGSWVQPPGPKSGPHTRWVVMTAAGPQFALVTQVTIPARLNFNKDWEKFRSKALQRLRKSATDLVQGLQRGTRTGRLRGAGGRFIAG